MVCSCGLYSFPMMCSEQLLINTVVAVAGESRSSYKTFPVLKWRVTAKAVSKCSTGDATALKHGVNRNKRNSGSANFQLLSQDEMQHEKQSECGYHQHYRIESEYAERDSEIAFLETEEHVRFIAAAVVVLLHLGS